MALIRRVLVGTLGAGLTLVGFALFLSVYAPDEYAEPLPLWRKAGVVILGVAVGATGIWLARYSLRRRDPD
jgi:hypothetical protein